jgi:hypothetical protein
MGYNAAGKRLWDCITEKYVILLVTIFKNAIIVCPKGGLHEPVTISCSVGKNFVVNMLIIVLIQHQLIYVKT